MSKGGEPEENHTFRFTVTDLEPARRPPPVPKPPPIPTAAKAKHSIGTAATEPQGIPSSEIVTAVATPAMVDRALRNDPEEDEKTIVSERRKEKATMLQKPKPKGARNFVRHESLTDGTLTVPKEPSKTARAGQTIADRYRIEESIASGGMGRVHKVEHLHLGKTFALKQIHESFDSDQGFRDKFYREARLASGLSHRNIVSIVDFGEDPEIGVFMVMELVEGKPLSKRLRKGERFPLRMACEIILQIADALHYIHKEGIVHGDIKPDNILLRRAGKSELQRWNICLLDFGLARSHQSNAIDEEHIEGTPAYMAPEIICGQPLREGSDIYSLGVLAYQLVTGKPPFRGDLRQLMTQHLKDKPKPLSETLGEEVDERLEALVMKALEKDPANRQASMAAFLFEMKTLMDMLGFGGGRRAKVAHRTDEDSSLRWSHLAFEHCDVGLALVSTSGEVLAGNHAFCHFFRRKPGTELKDMTILDPRFLRIHPDLHSDVEKVIRSRSPQRRVLRFEGRGGESVEILFALSPVTGETDRLVLSIVPIDS